MADIINTLRGPKFFRDGTIRGMYYIIPVQPKYHVTADTFYAKGYNTHEREYYRLHADGEWHWSHTEESNFQKYPCYQEPEWTLPEGV